MIPGAGSLQTQLGTQLWQLVSPGLWHCWDGECAYYQLASGDTHLLSEEAVRLLEHLQDRPRNVGELAASLSEMYSQPPEPSQMDLHVIALLDDLAKARLVECSPA